MLPTPRLRKRKPGLQTNLQNAWVKWNMGYRLPTEAEWEKAARGGASGHRFPWSDADTITHSRINYYSTASYAYDISPTRGYYPGLPQADLTPPRQVFFTERLWTL